MRFGVDLANERAKTRLDGSPTSQSRWCAVFARARASQSGALYLDERQGHLRTQTGAWMEGAERGTGWGEFVGS